MLLFSSRIAQKFPAVSQFRVTACASLLSVLGYANYHRVVKPVRTVRPRPTPALSMPLTLRPHAVRTCLAPPPGAAGGDRCSLLPLLKPGAPIGAPTLLFPVNSHLREIGCPSWPVSVGRQATQTGSPRQPSPPPYPLHTVTPHSRANPLLVRYRYHTSWIAEPVVWRISFALAEQCRPWLQHR